MKEEKKLNHILIRVILLCAGLSVMAIGVAFSIKAALGTSPISSVPFVTGTISGLSVGTTTIIMNCIFVVIQILILRKRFEWFQLLQIPASILFGTMIDAGGVILQGLSCSNYMEQWVFCMIGIVLLAFGVSMEITARLITSGGEGVVLAVCKVLPVKFGDMKVIFDLTLVCISILIGLLLLGHLEGVREGTIAAALCVGLITKRFNKPMARLEEKYLM